MRSFLRFIIVSVQFVLPGCQDQPPGQFAISQPPRVFLLVLEVAIFHQSGACLSGQSSLVRRRYHRCWCHCYCDWSGCRWCVKVRAKSQGCPLGKILQNKSRALDSRRLDFPLKGKSEVENWSLVCIYVKEAGRAALPGPFTSVLKKQGGRKKNLRPGSVKRSGWSTRIRSANCIRAIPRDIY